MDNTTEPMTIDSAVDAIMAEDDAPAPETTEDEQSEVSDTEEVEVEASDEDTTEPEADEEAEPDAAEADEADEEESDEDEAEDAETDEIEQIPVMVDGQEELKTLDELKASYSGQAKIRNDIWQNAQARKQLESAAQVMMERETQILQMHQQLQQGGFKSAPSQPDPSLIDSDPTEYMRQQARFQNDIAEYQNEQAQLAQLQQRQAAFQQHQKSEFNASQFEVLKQRIPEMADEKTAPEFARKLMSTGTEYGFSGAELGEIDDPRALEVLRDAMHWRTLQAKQKASKTPPQPSRNMKAKAAVKPVAGAKAKAAKARFDNTGSISDAVDAFLAE